MLYTSVTACVGRTPLVQLGRQFPPPGPTVIAKLELMNPSGSMKDRSAAYIVERGLADGTITAGTHLIESSSGNFGIALATAARVHDLDFTCVVDPKTTRANLRILQHLGATVELVTEPDPHGCFLDCRLRRVAALCREVPGALWINQYANERNWQAHYHGTAGEILADLDRPLDCLVVPVSTTGTILGLARRLRVSFPDLHVVAVDAAGSVIFGGPPGPRHVPGLGAGRRPELLAPGEMGQGEMGQGEIDEVVSVSDREAVAGCRSLAATEGILAGGSSGAVVAALARLRPGLPAGWQVLTVLPDRGDRYLDQVYDDEWVARLPEEVGQAEVEPVEVASPTVEPAAVAR
ncbi:MAG: N-(2-amino-2-carboxyethyl)-L-glutamate synthase [Actinomycetota bacterium]|nr:N-(2-amino-2-carboxyethyl)-L-glutamate synthase [Actinomycetota bacterium]